MSILASDLKRFYAMRSGRLIRRFINARIDFFWNDMSATRVLGYGYCLPFLRPFVSKSERVFAVMPKLFGVHFWSTERSSSHGVVCIADEDHLPIETESVDRIVVAHGFENAQDINLTMQELWRVLKSNGRMLLIVPNRHGLWARADWTPFGHGRPYSKKQILSVLRDNHFVYERSDKALFMPPFKSFFALRTAYFFESFGRFFLSGLSGLHIIEVSKQVYSGHTVSSQTVKNRRYVVADQGVGV